MHHLLAVLVFSLLTSAALSGCGVLPIDNRDKIARAILTHPGGGTNDAAMQAAFNAKYPAGTPPREIKELVSGFGGVCTEPKDGAMSCTMPAYNAICVSYYLALVVNLDANSLVRSVEVKSGNHTC